MLIIPAGMAFADSQTGTITSNVAFKNDTGYGIAIIQISPTGQNTWTDLLSAMRAENISNQLATGESLVLPMTFNNGTLWDIKSTFPDLSFSDDSSGNPIPASFVVTGVDFSGISSAPGTSIDLYNDILTGNTEARVALESLSLAPPSSDQEAALSYINTYRASFHHRRNHGSSPGQPD
jgi:hypothetical protein